MYAHTAQAETLLDQALKAVRAGGAELAEALEALPAPIYVTDANGVVTYFNSACVGLAGRRPAVGKDRWCVTWALYTNDGARLPHERCPMAVAIKERRPIRGVTAIAARPDGTRVSFLPLPTPLMSQDGELLGAVNILIDITDVRQAAELRAQAARCRRLARDMSDSSYARNLLAMAQECEAKASQLERSSVYATLG